MVCMEDLNRLQIINPPCAHELCSPCYNTIMTTGAPRCPMCRASYLDVATPTPRPRAPMRLPSDRLVQPNSAPSAVVPTAPFYHNHHEWLWEAIPTPHPTSLAYPVPLNNNYGTTIPTHYSHRFNHTILLNNNQREWWNSITWADWYVLIGTGLRIVGYFLDQLAIATRRV